MDRPNWKKMTVGELCDTISDTYCRNDNEVVLINTSDVLEGKVLNHNRVENKQLKGQFKKTFKKDDILYSEIRPANKRYAFVDFEDTKQYIASTKLMVLRANKELVLPRFLFSFLTSNKVLAELQLLAETRSGTFPQITFSSELATMTIFVPDFSTQEKIVGIIENIDAKIQNNSRINDNLLQQAQAIFKHWFTDNPNLDDMKQVPLAELCLVVTKGTTPTTLGKPFVTEGINFIKVESILDNHTFDQNKFAFIDSETNNLLKRSIIHSGDIIFTIAGTLGRFALIDDSVLPANTNQAVAIIRANQNKVTPDYLYSFFLGNWHNDYYRKRIQQAVQANLNLGTIKSLPIPILPDKAMSEYLGILSPIITMTKANELEITRLRAIRDTLLPKLMSGQVDVSAIEL